MIQLVKGNCVDVLREMPANSYDGIITDPPYSSGGPERVATSGNTKAKYTSHKQANPLPDFYGETMDTHSWMWFMEQVMGEAWRVSKEGGIICVFSDWRKHAPLSDVLQASGWRWMGTAIWDKTEGVRPQRGRLRQQAEFILWGSKGTLPIDRTVPVLPGVFRYANVSHNKLHQCQKPLQLMRDICKIVIPGGRILDPFCGSGTTLEAAQLEGYDATGIEQSESIYQIAKARLSSPPAA